MNGRTKKTETGPQTTNLQLNERLFSTGLAPRARFTPTPRRPRVDEVCGPEILLEAFELEELLGTPRRGGGSPAPNKTGRRGKGGENSRGREELSRH